MRTLLAVTVAFGLVMAGAARAQSATESEIAAEIAEAESEYAEWAKQYGSMARTCNENTIQSLTAIRTEFPNTGLNHMELKLFEARRDHQERLEHPNGYLKTWNTLFAFEDNAQSTRSLLLETWEYVGESFLESTVAERKEDAIEMVGLMCELADLSHNLLEDFRRTERQ